MAYGIKVYLGKCILIRVSWSRRRVYKSCEQYDFYTFGRPTAPRSEYFLFVHRYLICLLKEIIASVTNKTCEVKRSRCFIC